ncbi:MAG TPA: phosphoglycerate dehydrogenase [bacterium]|nr:phosphoglycerate dehydrogenase [bacterium]
MRVLVADGLADEGLRRLSAAGEVVVRAGVPDDELRSLLTEFDALIVRSRTRVPAGSLDAAGHLRVIARAGVGVDNIDVEAATRRGILVLNTPDSSTVAAAEHTFAMMLALARHVPNAAQALARGEWTRERFLGTELTGKTLGVVGLGKIGSEVARRALAFGMRVVASDPYVSEERARRLGVELAPWPDILDPADVVTLHVPLGHDTRALVGPDELARMKPGAFLVNCARGGLVDETALLAALERGQLGGAALDVFATEPPGPDNPLLRHPRVVATPHLGGSTVEAQRSIAVEVADQVLAALRGEPVRGAVNAPALGEEVWQRLDPFLHLARSLGGLAGQLADGQIRAVALVYEGEVARLDTQPLTASVLVGLLRHASDQPVNLVNAVLLAKERGLRVSESHTDLCEDFASQLVAEIETSRGTLRLGGTLWGHREPRITRLNAWRLDLAPAPHMLFVWNADRPGMIGHVGTILGRRGVNIANMHVGRLELPDGRPLVGRHDAGGTAVMVLTLDDAPPVEVTREIAQADGITAVRTTRLPAA